jgi:hypothetical protein
MVLSRPALQRKNRFYRKIGRPIQFTPEEIQDLFIEKEKPHVKKRSTTDKTRRAATKR